MLRSVLSVISELNQLILLGSCIKVDDIEEEEEKERATCQSYIRLGREGECTLVNVHRNAW